MRGRDRFFCWIKQMKNKSRIRNYELENAHVLWYINLIKNDS